MIRFECRCRHALEAPDDQAGLTMQCPSCGLLVDIPHVSDLASIEPDGTYRLDAPPPNKPNENLDILSLVYYPARQLPDGSEIDLRGPVDPMPLAEPLDPPRPVRLKYDPDTGELVEPLEINQDEGVPPELSPHIPTAQRVIDYNVTPHALEGSPHGLGVYAALFLPVNLMVMLITAGVHVIFTFAAFLAYHLFLLVPIALGFAAMIAGTFTIAVQEIGPAERDELPRPLRNVAIYDDYIAPALHAFSAIFLCYWPGLLILSLNFLAAASGKGLPFPTAAPWLLGSFFLGAWLMPSILLTVCTSGTVLNLRPDRVLGVMRAIGWHYPLLVAEWLVGSSVYAFAAAALWASWFVTSDHLVLKPFIVFPSLMAGIYLCFAFCWHVGIEYRMHWSVFPWVAQKHERVQPPAVTIRRPTLHPKVAAAEQNAARRAQSRGEIR